jgi:hypothetical protein
MSPPTDSASDLDRLRVLELQVTDLRIVNAQLFSTMEHLAKATDSLNETVDNLRDTINKGRGAVWLAIMVAGAAGATIGSIIKSLFGIH